MTTVRITKTKGREFVGQVKEWSKTYEGTSANVEIEYGANFIGDYLAFWIVTKDYDDMKEENLFSMDKGFRTETNPTTREVYSTSFKVNSWSKGDREKYMMHNIFTYSTAETMDIVDSLQDGFDNWKEVLIQTNKDGIGLIRRGKK